MECQRGKEASTICRNCGTVLSARSKFCNECGSKVDECGSKVDTTPRAPPTAPDNTTAALLSALEDYHPSKLIEWLQRRTTRLEDQPALGSPALDEDLYEALQVPPDAGPSQIRRAYRQLALVTHPDKATGDRFEFERIARAYDVLSDTPKREAYDHKRRNAAVLPRRPPRVVLRSSRDVADDFAKDLEHVGHTVSEALRGVSEKLLASLISEHGHRDSVSSASKLGHRDEKPPAKHSRCHEMPSARQPGFFDDVPPIAKPSNCRQGPTDTVGGRQQSQRSPWRSAAAEFAGSGQSERRRVRASGAEFLGEDRPMPTNGADFL